jgi:hypothetical protein
LGEIKTEKLGVASRTGLIEESGLGNGRSFRLGGESFDRPYDGCPKRRCVRGLTGLTPMRPPCRRQPAGVTYNQSANPSRLLSPFPRRGRKGDSQIDAAYSAPRYEANRQVSPPMNDGAKRRRNKRRRERSDPPSDDGFATRMNNRKLGVRVARRRRHQVRGNPNRTTRLRLWLRSGRGSPRRETRVCPNAMGSVSRSAPLASVVFQERGPMPFRQG